MPSILDSGERRQFSSGAVRDISENKGRMDLIPWSVVSELTKWICTRQLLVQNQVKLRYSSTFDLTSASSSIDKFLHTGERTLIFTLIWQFIESAYDGNLESAILDLAIHYEQGAKKYEERNWEKGIDCHCYVDSGMRHCLKYFRGDNDEPHGRAFLWNMFGLLWTLDNKPEFNDLPFVKSQKREALRYTE